MSLQDGSWTIRLEGHEQVSTDDLTLDELEMAERACGVPYTLMDPHVSVRIAKALLAVCLLRANLRAGMAEAAAEDDALRRVRKLTTAALHGAFQWVPPGKPRPPATGTEAPADPPLSAATSPAG